MREKSILIILTTAVLEILMYNRTPGTDNKGNLLALALQQLHAWFIKIHRRIWLFFLVKIQQPITCMHSLYPKHLSRCCSYFRETARRSMISFNTI